MTCILVAAACWMPPLPIPVAPLPPVRTEWQEHGWRLPPPVTVSVPPHRHQTIPAHVEQWRPLVAHWFGARADEALTVIACESRGDPSAVNSRSGASGLFQHLARFWPERSAAAGWAGADILDPAANIAVAAWLSDGGTVWTHWVCKP